MLDVAADAGDRAEEEQRIWRALASPVRRQLLDQLSVGPRTTGQLAESAPSLSRFAVMQHLGVLTEAGLVVARKRGRERFNHLNAVPLRQWYERWVGPLANVAATEVVALQRYVEGRGGPGMAADDVVRTVRIESELRFAATPERIFKALTEEVREWFPHTYGEERVRAIVMEPRVGGAYFEDWGGGMGHLYGHVTVYDRPNRLCLRGRVMPGTILDTEYDIEADGGEAVLAMTKVAVGPMSLDEAASIRTFGDIARFEDAVRGLVEGR